MSVSSAAPALGCPLSPFGAPGRASGMPVFLFPVPFKRHGQPFPAAFFPAYRSPSSSYLPGSPGLLHGPALCEDYPLPSSCPYPAGRSVCPDLLQQSGKKCAHRSWLQSSSPDSMGTYVLIRRYTMRHMRSLVLFLILMAVPFGAASADTGKDDGQKSSATASRPPLKGLRVASPAMCGSIPSIRQTTPCVPAAAA